MSNIMSVLFASENESKLNELTIHRTAASLPFCGRYRLLDFVLSNLVNSGITTIGIIARSNYNSLMDHIRMGRDWDLNRKNSGIAVFPPFVTNNARDIYKSKIDALYSMSDYISRAKEEYIIITNGNIAYNFDYELLFDEHIAKKADITMLTYRSAATARRVLPVVGKNGRVTEFLFGVTAPSGEIADVAMNVYLMKKSLLLSLIEGAYSRGQLDFEKDILLSKVAELKIFAYDVKGYVALIDDIKSYYYASMKLLEKKARDELFDSYGNIYTKVKDSVPTAYGDKATVKNSLIADGCRINGYVENSILFRGVNIDEGARVVNSIIMENGQIMSGSHMSYVITDKNVVIREKRNISGFETYPIVIVKDKIV
ncbi:MAG: glucose-1-phosphate adenylyltransferase subunit GlgD [Clostridiales bacterium]|jgi:glucose-1-phosphate adenylyltransferase|nr:glucose-1-phosphate adenylyltransferase subunit GlgD [Clostridiales bacterium]